MAAGGKRAAASGACGGVPQRGISAQGPHFVSAFRRGLSETGFIEGKDATIDYQFADGRYDRLPAMAADLVHRQVNVLVTAGPPAANAARAATTSIPIIFIVGLDPVAAGLVESFNRPGGNATGISLVTGPRPETAGADTGSRS